MSLDDRLRKRTSERLGVVKMGVTAGVFGIVLMAVLAAVTGKAVFFGVLGFFVIGTAGNAWLWKRLNRLARPDV